MLLVVTFTILLIYKLLLAQKDGNSYLLKDNSTPDVPIRFKRIKRWHREGVVLDLILTGVLAWANHLYLSTFLMSILIRLSVFDLMFNYVAGLPISFIGDTAASDKFFSKIFGLRGAVKKSLFFLIVCILWIVLNTFVFKINL